jgi:membrane protease YdiL (CAAX protease family)
MDKQPLPGPRAGHLVSPSAVPRGGEERDFSQLARLGPSSWRRHLAGLTIILFCWIVVGGAATLALMLLLGGLGPMPMSGYLVANAPFPFLLAGVVIAVRYVYRRPVHSLITPKQRIDGRRIAWSFGLFFLLAGAATLIEAVLDPGRFHLTLSPAWLLTLPVLVVITCLQTSTEELFFRGYLLQAMGLLTRRGWLLVALNTVVFAVPHLINPEMATGSPLLAAVYFGLGAFFTILTLRDNRLELALGAHAANNLFAALVVNHDNSSLPTRAIWQVSELNPAFILVSFLITAPLFYWAMFGRALRVDPGAQTR